MILLLDCPASTVDDNGTPRTVLVSSSSSDAKKNEPVANVDQVRAPPFATLLLVSITFLSQWSVTWQARL